MEGKIRRVITGHDSKGRAIVISDGLAPAVRTNPMRPGHISVDLWKTSASPVVLSANEADPTLGPKQIHPPPHGTLIRISEIAPETEAIRNLPPDRARDRYQAPECRARRNCGAGSRRSTRFRRRGSTVPARGAR